MLASSRAPRGTATAPGGINPAPTDKFCVSGQTGTATTHRTTVGRDALIPPHPAPPQTPAGGINPAPTNEFCVSGQTGTAATHPGVRRAGCPHPAVSHGGANVSILNRQCAAGVNARPTKPETCGGQPGNRGPALQQTPVGADSISAREPRGTANARGRDKSRPYGRRRPPAAPSPPRPLAQGGFFVALFTKTPRFICRICAAARPSGKILQPFGAARGFHGRPFMV